MVFFFFLPPRAARPALLCASTWLGWSCWSWADALLPITSFFAAVPYFWLGLIAIMLFAVTWRIFPAAGSTTPA